MTAPALQVLDGDTAKSFGFGAIDKPPRVSGAPPVLVKVNVFAGLVAPTSTDPKLAGAVAVDVGETAAAGTLCPDRTTSCGPAFVRMVRVAELAPAAGT